jgi:hypothetical protein
MIARIRQVGAAILLALAACTGRRVEHPAGVMTFEDRSVWSAVLAWEYGGSVRLGSQLVVQTETEAPSVSWRDTTVISTLSPFHRSSLRGLRPETERDFVRRVRVPERIGGPLLLAAPYTWITREEAARANRDFRIWQHTVKGHGVLVLSSVGYDRGHTQALVYLVDECPLCGFAKYVLLERSGLEWRVVADAEEWVS